MKKNNKSKFKRLVSLLMLSVLIVASIPALPKTVFGSGGGTASMEDIMKGLSTFVYKMYEWPESLSIGSNVFSIVESLYTMKNSSTGDSVLWNDDTLEKAMKDFYSSTDWHQFEGMYETLEVSNRCEAELTNEVIAYEQLMDTAAEENGFTVYKELFKAIAQARFNENKGEYAKADHLGKINGTGDDAFDLFHIDGSWIDGGKTPIEVVAPPSPSVSPVPTAVPTAAPASLLPIAITATPEITPAVTVPDPPYTVKQSIDLAAKAFRWIIDEAVFPSPYNTDGLICVVEGFEFGGNSAAIQERYASCTSPGTSFTSFTSFCQTQASLAGDDVDYDKIIEDYAKIIAGNATRGDDDHDTYGKYKYSDQLFYQKVYEVYKCTGGGGSLDLGNLPEEYRDIMKKCMATWGSEVTEKRREIIQNGILLFGVQYSMDNRNCPSPQNPKWLDCSSFTGQCYWRAGLYDIRTAGWTTGNFASEFTQIEESELIPADVGQKTWVAGSSGGKEHIGIYVGTVDGTKYWLHCTRDDYGNNGIVVNSYSGFRCFGRSDKL